MSLKYFYVKIVPHRHTSDFQYNASEAPPVGEVRLYAFLEGGLQVRDPLERQLQVRLVLLKVRLHLSHTTLLQHGDEQHCTRKDIFVIKNSLITIFIAQFKQLWMQLTAQIKSEKF